MKPAHLHNLQRAAYAGRWILEAIPEKNLGEPGVRELRNLVVAVEGYLEDEEGEELLRRRRHPRGHLFLP